MTRVFLAAILCTVSSTLFAADWPEFRGPSGNGVVEATGLPLTWSDTENVTWKTEIPHKGWSTPVVLGGQIWLTTATLEGNDFYAICVDAESGQIVFNERLFHSDNPEPLGNDVNTYASPSPVIEAGRVYVHFGSYGTACLDTESKTVLWQRTDLQCRHFRGPGSSLVLFEDLLIVTFDGVDVQYVVALDKMSGKTVWKTDRNTEWHDLDETGKPKREGDFRKSFSTPLVIDAPSGKQLISLGSSAAFAYEPRTGKEIWKTHNTAYTPAARPVYGNGVAFITTGRGGQQELWAVRVDGHGDVTDTHVAWRIKGPLVPEEPSPILVGDLLYTVSGDGAGSCIEAGTGRVVWTERIGGNYEASPICAGDRIYFFSTQGKTTVLKAGPVYEVLATSRLEDGLMASPAVSGNSLILRTKTHLYRIESTE